MQFHIVQKHGSASTAVLGKKKQQKMKVGGGGDVCCVAFFLYQQSCGLLLPSPPHKTKLVIAFGCVPFLLCLTVKVEL